MTEPLFPLLGLSRLRIGTDGAGVTTLIAGAGCPLACRWCINAALLKQEPEFVTATELFERVKRDELYYLATGGGVCFGGGEALLHAPLMATFRQLAGESWKITAETSLNVEPSLVELAAQTVDRFIVDIKSLEEAIYIWYTGKSGALARENLRLLLKLAGAERIQVRVPLIPEYNTPKQQKQTARLLQEMGIPQPELFAYKTTK